MPVRLLVLLIWVLVCHDMVVHVGFTLTHLHDNEACIHEMPCAVIVGALMLKSLLSLRNEPLLWCSQAGFRKHEPPSCLVL